LNRYSLLRITSMLLVGSNVGIGKSIVEFVPVPLFVQIPCLSLKDRPNGRAIASITLAWAVTGIGLTRLKVKRVPLLAS